MALTTDFSVRKGPGVRIARAVAVMVILAIEPVCVSAASYQFEPDPIGERAYAAHSWSRMAPLLVILGALVLAWVFNRIRRKTKKLAPDHAGSHHG